MSYKPIGLIFPLFSDHPFYHRHRRYGHRQLMRCYGDSMQYHVFEMSRPLPRFSMYSLLDDNHGIPEPQGHVTFHVKERINRVSFLNILLSSLFHHILFD